MPILRKDLEEADDDDDVVDVVDVVDDADDDAADDGTADVAVISSITSFTLQRYNCLSVAMAFAYTFAISSNIGERNNGAM